MLDLVARTVVRRRWAVLGAWAGLGALGAVGARGVEDRLDLQGGGNRPTEASRAAELFRARFGRGAGETFLVALTGPAPLDSGPPRRVLDTLAATLARAPYVRAVTTFASEDDATLFTADRRTTAVLVVLSVAAPDSVLKLVEPVRAAVRRVLATTPGGADLRAAVTGDTPLERDLLTVTTADVTRSERRLVPVAAVILVLAFGSVVAALVPLAIGFLAITIGLGLVAGVAAVTPMSVYVLNVATMIGLGVGIDYSLLVVARFREERARGVALEEAVARTLRTAGATAAVSGLTVMVGFAALLVTPLVETRSIGIGGLVVVAVAVAAALTLLPALLAVLGPRLGWAAQRRSHPRAWERWGRIVSRRPGRALALGAIVVLCLAAPAWRMQLGLPSRQWWPRGTEAGEGVDLLARLARMGDVQPVRVLVRFPDGRRAVDAGSLRALRAVSDSLRADPRVRDVTSVVDVGSRASLLEYALLYSDLHAARARHPVFLDQFLSADGGVARLDVMLHDTTSLTSAGEVVRRARRLAAGGVPLPPGAEVLVGGYVAQNLDAQDALLGRFPLLVALVFGATALVLGLVFRSLVIPVKAIVLNTLSVAAAYGVIVLVFQRGAGARLFGLGGPIDAIFAPVPVLVFAVVFGLSMDYEVFLLSRIKEAFDRTGRNEAATIEAVGATGSVISAAALLMITVFGTFAFARTLVIQLLGFGLAVAVLLDATLIRLVLVPAFMRLAGRWNWWPGRFTA